ncbi:hypothetical protein FB45DRAFT_391883, partial [Roridomyces roridus]
MWSIYVDEAERYDAGLVESWKADMEGMLIFSGLFSASLTAFLIESYKNLQPDSGDLAVAAMTQISQQLAAMSTGHAAPVQPPSQFTPTIASLVCNALWFVSLSLSLMCALLATLVEQWAREFLHKTNRRPSPVRRARIFAFLYFGLKRFRMHTVVDTIPSLIHGSLLLFFIGLVFFLVPVNSIIMYLMAGALLTFLLLYSILTILPVVYVDCPYRTPLSTPLWSLSRRAVAFLCQPTDMRHSIVTMAEATLDSAVQNTAKRDQRALKWTLDSLTDDDELLPFVEILPEVLSGRDGRLCTVDEQHLLRLVLGDLETPSPLIARLVNLFISSPGPDNPLCIRRRIASVKALSALCTMPRAWEYRFDTERLVGSNLDLYHETAFCPGTVLLALHYHSFRWRQHLLSALREQLKFDHYSSDLRSRATSSLCARLELLGGSGYMELGHDAPAIQDLQNMAAEIGQRTPTAAQLGRVQQAIEALCDLYDWPRKFIPSMSSFFHNAFLTLKQGASVSELDSACAIVAEIRRSPSRTPWIRVGSLFRIPDALELHKFTVDHQKPHQLDVLARMLFSFFPFLSYEDQRDTDGYLRFLVERGSPDAVYRALIPCGGGAGQWDSMWAQVPVLDALAISLGSQLTEQTELRPQALRIVHAILVVYDCLRAHGHWHARDFMRAVMARVSVKAHWQYPIIQTVYRLWRLPALNAAVTALSELPSTVEVFSRLQKSCQDESLPQIDPSALPVNMDVNTLAQTLRKHLVHRYIDALVDLLAAPTLISIKGYVRWADWDTLLDVPWPEVDPDVQHGLFAAILTQYRILIPPRRFDDAEVAFLAGFWSAGIFSFCNSDSDSSE